MGLFTEDPKTSISLYIDNLSNYDDIEWYQFQQLTDLLAQRHNGAREAIEAVRKRLKHGTPQQQLRALEVLKLLMENSNQRFHRELVNNEKMTERLEIIIESPIEDIKVRKHLVMLLGLWSRKYAHENDIKYLSRLYERGRHNLAPAEAAAHKSNKRRSASPQRLGTSAAVLYRYTSDTSDSLRRPPRSYSLAGKNASLQRTPPPSPPPPNSTRNSSSRNPTNITATFDFEKAKPKIIQQVAIASQSANKLINELRLAKNSTADEPSVWESDLRNNTGVKQALARCEEERKKIVRYARLVEDEEWIGTLLTANEELLKAIDMHNNMKMGQLVPTGYSTAIAEDEKRNSAMLLIDCDSSSIINSNSNSTGRMMENNPIYQEELLEDPFADPF